MPEELSRIKSMDEWARDAFPSSDRSFLRISKRSLSRRREGFWFYNGGVPTYITGRHYMMLQWTEWISVIRLSCVPKRYFLHMAACEADPRCIGQLYTKCQA